MPGVSVIVPIYNAEPFLAQCLESLLNQTYRDLQIILVDDGSTDNSHSIAEHYASKDKRIELYTQSNQGQSAARNNGMLHATGDYISFIDSDDYIDADFYQALLHAGQPDTDVVQIGYRRVQEGKVLIEQCPRTFFQFTSPCMRLYRRDFLTRHHLTFTEGMIYEDVLFSIDLWSAHPTYRMAHYTGYNYRLNPHSTTAARNRQAEQTLFAALRQR
ncbi:MAG TPA: hypothetical protein DIW30_08180 [Bacteroidales bacterium]|nr:hypothetical protein [Bacteroidales bacterium]